MLETQTTLITILKEVISTNKLKINNCLDNGNLLKEKYKKELNLLKKDKYNIININLAVIRKILEELDINYKEKKLIYDNIKSIKEMLLLNENAHTTYKIYNNQIKYLDKFINYIENYKDNNIPEKELEELKEMTFKYEELYNKLENPNNNDYMEDLDTINLLLDECKIDDKTEREILFNIMRYNLKCKNNNT